MSTPISSPSTLRLPFRPDDIRRAESLRWWYWSLAVAIHACILAYGYANVSVHLPLPLHAVQPLQAQLRAANLAESEPAPLHSAPQAVSRRPRGHAPELLSPVERPAASSSPSPVPSTAPERVPEAAPAPRSEARPVVAARFDADYLHNPKPVYPPLSRRLQEEGKVLLTVWVGVQGQALETLLQKSSGYSRLDQAALDAVSRWRFVPARRGDENVESWVSVPIQFLLDHE